MLNICAQCGQYRADKIIEGAYAICPECGYKHPFLRLPLLLIGGASGTGKSTVCRALLGQSNTVVLLDSDIIWRPEFNRPEDKYRDFFETWLRLCKNIGQSGRPVALFGAGVGVPENLEPCVERPYFSGLHYLALTCAPETLAERLRSRPDWRHSGELAYIDEHVKFNRWFQENASKTRPTIDLLDTTGAALEDTAAQVMHWIHEKAGQ